MEGRKTREIGKLSKFTLAEMGRESGILGMNKENLSKFTLGATKNGPENGESISSQLR